MVPPTSADHARPRLARLIDVDAPVVRVRYELAEKNLTLAEVLGDNADRLEL